MKFHCVMASGLVLNFLANALPLSQIDSTHLPYEPRRLSYSVVQVDGGPSAVETDDTPNVVTVPVPAPPTTRTVLSTVTLHPTPSISPPETPSSSEAPTAAKPTPTMHTTVTTGMTTHSEPNSPFPTPILSSSCTLSEVYSTPTALPPVSTDLLPLPSEVHSTPTALPPVSTDLLPLPSEAYSTTTALPPISTDLLPLPSAASMGISIEHTPSHTNSSRLVFHPPKLTPLPLI
ncbi:hypothetical protein LOZ53_002388 [Ophidiomyces ophidiicola]|nr:hypothetical protein LOZ53_002388 [Ophidiomyces ophidiicola]KAI1992938.1 hypothetical protein LOZ51_004252 [Ophidiomyces ophidiicola]